jgi:conjugal transfer pilus assembly protein TraF
MRARSFIRRYRFGSLGCCLLLLAAAVAAEAAAPPPAASFYQESKHGWFWYEDPVPDEEDPGLQKEPRQTPSLARYTSQELWDLHPDDFQELLNGLHKKAVQYPTEQHLLEYLLIQDIARRKALAYANAAQYVTQKRADLFTINQVYPTSSPGVAARVQLQNEEIAETISQARGDHALLFFVAPGCGFCDKQAQILAYFVERYGWQVRPVDITGNPELALRFNITTTPALLLIRQDRDQSMPIAIGVVSLPEIERKLYQAIRFMAGTTGVDSFTTYDFQKDSALDPASILKIEQPWQGSSSDNSRTPPRRRP